MNKKLIMFASTLFIVSALVGCKAPAEKPIVDDNDDNNYTTTEENNGPNNGAGITNNNDLGNNDLGMNGEDGYSYLGMNTDDNYEEGNIMNNSTSAGENDVASLMQDEDRLEKRISNLKGVSNAVVMIEDDTAYCGVDYTDDDNTSTINSLRQKISNEVKTLCPQVDSVFVTADKTSYDRMKEYLSESGITNRSTKLANSIKNIFR